MCVQHDIDIFHYRVHTLKLRKLCHRLCENGSMCSQMANLRQHSILLAEQSWPKLQMFPSFSTCHRIRLTYNRSPCFQIRNCSVFISSTDPRRSKSTVHSLFGPPTPSSTPGNQSYHDTRNTPKLANESVVLQPVPPGIARTCNLYSAVKYSWCPCFPVTLSHL
jgi:hypothetical protein